MQEKAEMPTLLLLPCYSVLATHQSKSTFFNVKPKSETAHTEILLQPSVGDQGISFRQQGRQQSIEKLN